MFPVPIIRGVTDLPPNNSLLDTTHVDRFLGVFFLIFAFLKYTNELLYTGWRTR